MILTKSTLVLTKWCLFSDIEEIDSGIGEMVSVQHLVVTLKIDSGIGGNNELKKSGISGIGDLFIEPGIGGNNELMKSGISGISEMASVQ